MHTTDCPAPRLTSGGIAPVRPRGRGPERLLLGITWLTFVQLGAAQASEAALPVGSETLLEPDTPLLSTDDPSERAEPAPAQSHATTRSARPAARGESEPRLATAVIPSVTDPRPDARPAADDPLALKDFTLKEFSLKEFAPREFRPRPRSLLEGSERLGAEDSMIGDTDTWQRLASEYRSHGRLRVITLWDAGWSSLSLQAGKHGDPYLQWSGHLFGQSERAHGLLDHFVSTPASGKEDGHGVAHPLAPAASKPSSSSVAAHLNALP